MKVVIDTNVLLSAAFRDRLPERVVLWCVGNPQLMWLVTDDIVEEYLSVLRRPKFGLRQRLSPSSPFRALAIPIFAFAGMVGSACREHAWHQARVRTGFQSLLGVRLDHLATAERGRSWIGRTRRGVAVGITGFCRERFRGTSPFIHNK